MPILNRWSPLAQFPVTKTLHKCLPKSKSTGNKPHIVSEKLCDDVLQRLSPFLMRKPPVDILDLWPGPGVLSSKVNDLFKPRRHVLIEPDLNAYKPVLEPLAKSRPCYELLSTDIRSIQDWKSVLSQYFPEQGASNMVKNGALAKNDTLLVLAHPPPAVSTRDHYTAARWWSVFMETCMRQTGLHTYGSVRLLASVPMVESPAILPRAIGVRNRPALLTEQVALHAFEVAAPPDQTTGDWAFWKQWDLLVGGEARVAQRTSEQEVVIPLGRAYPTIEPAPESPIPGRKPAPYTLRVKTRQDDKYLQTFAAFDKTSSKSPNYQAMKKERTRACIQLNQENRQVYIRSTFANKQAEIDELNKTIARLAADSKSDSATLEPIVQEIETIKSSLVEEISQHHYDITRSLPGLIDDKRAAFHSGNFDNALLLWDRRPFEPLLIHPEEVYPRNTDRALIYFEANPSSLAVRKMNNIAPEQREIASRFFEAISQSLKTHNTLTISGLIELVFPNHSTNDLVKAVPSLANYASKRPKADFDSLPKTLHYNPEDFGDASSPDPVSCYQENLDYDLDDVRIRLLSPATLWDLCVEYSRSGADQSLVQLTRILGGTLTSAQSREFLNDTKILR